MPNTRGLYMQWKPNIQITVRRPSLVAVCVCMYVAVCRREAQFSKAVHARQFAVKCDAGTCMRTVRFIIVSPSCPWFSHSTPVLATNTLIGPRLLLNDFLSHHFAPNFKSSWSFKFKKMKKYCPKQQFYTTLGSRKGGEARSFPFLNALFSTPVGLKSFTGNFLKHRACACNVYYYS